MAVNFLAGQGTPLVIGPVAVAGSKTGFSLSSDATFSGSTMSGGAAIGWRFIAPATTTVTDVVFYVHTAPGSAHNLTVLLCGYGAATTRPGAYVTNGYVNVSGGTTSDKWVKATFSTPPSITVGEAYWIVICDENYDAGNVYQIQSRPASAPNNPSLLMGGAYTSTDGFTTAGTAVSSPTSLAIAFGDGTYFGQPFTARTASTSNQVYRGVKFTPTEDITLGGVIWLSNATLAGGTMAVYENGSGSVFSGFNGGSAFTLPANATAWSFCFRCPAFTLTGGTTYRIVVKPSVNDTDPNYIEIADYSTHQAILEGCSVSSDGTFIWTYHDGGGDPATGWTDVTYAIPAFGLLVVTNPPASGGNGYTGMMLV